MVCIRKSDCIDHICMIHTHVLRQCVVIVLVENQNNSHIFHRDISYSHDMYFYVIRSIVLFWTFFTTDQHFLSNSRFRPRPRSWLYFRNNNNRIQHNCHLPRWKFSSIPERIWTSIFWKQNSLNKIIWVNIFFSKHLFEPMIF